jgi:hypothetical protein
MSLQGQINENVGRLLKITSGIYWEESGWWEFPNDCCPRLCLVLDVTPWNGVKKEWVITGVGDIQKTNRIDGMTHTAEIGQAVFTILMSSGKYRIRMHPRDFVVIE